MLYLQNLGNSILNAIPSILAAIVVLALALLVAWLAKLVVTKLLKATKLDQKLNRVAIEDKKGATTVDYIGRLVFIIVFVLFLPSIFARLGLEGVASPISNMVNAIISYIPNLLAAALILFIGFFVARVVRDLLIPLLRKLGVDRFQNPKSAAKEAAGIEEATVEEKTTGVRLSTVLANIVYVLILIPIVIAALQTLKIEAISAPAIAMLNQIFMFIPQILLAIILIALGAFIARFVGNLLTQLLVSVGTDKWIASLMPGELKPRTFSIAKIIGKIVQVVIILFFVVEGLNVIQLSILQTIGAAIIAYLPNVLVAILILLAAMFLANWLEGFINLKLTNSKGVAVLAKVTVMVLALFIVFDQLNIADATVNAAFRYMMMGLAVAFALAFGLGGRDFAKNTLAKISERADEVAKDFRDTEDRELDEAIREAESRDQSFDSFAKDAEHLQHLQDEDTDHTPTEEGH